jgi:hypothetical protein
LGLVRHDALAAPDIAAHRAGPLRCSTSRSRSAGVEDMTKLLTVDSVGRILDLGRAPA